MTAPFEKTYPRIYSLSTISLIKHYNIDYLFHPFRTDFSGESGVGKTTIANLLQLILVGQSNFIPASNRDYTIAQYVVSKNQIGYAFINIEVDKGKFLIIGILLNAGSNNVQHFIIQLGSDDNNLAYLSKPIFHKEIIEFPPIPDFERLNELMETKGLHCEIYKLSEFQKILYKNEIIPFDFYNINNNARKFAKIMSSFSAGEDFKSANPKSIQQFLFGDEDYQRIKKQYEEKKAQIETEYSTSVKSKVGINTITDKGRGIQKLAKLKSRIKIHEESFYVSDFFYHEQQINSYTKRLLNVKNEQGKKEIAKVLCEYYIKQNEVDQQIKIITEIESLELKQQKLQQKLEKYNEKTLAKELEDIKVEQSKLAIKRGNISNLDTLVTYYNDVQSVKKNYEEYLKKKQLIPFIEYLNEEGIYQEYLQSTWSKNWAKGEEVYKSKLNSLSVKIQKLAAAKAFSNYADETSFINWVIYKSEEKTINKYQEAVIAHFFELSITPPESLELSNRHFRYIYNPKKLLDSAKNISSKAEEKEGFWLELQGIREFIKYPPTRFLDLSRDELLKEIDRNTIEIDALIGKHEHTINTIKHLKSKLNTYSDRNILTLFPYNKHLIALEHPEVFEKIYSREYLEECIQNYDNRIVTNEYYEKLTARSLEINNIEQLRKTLDETSKKLNAYDKQKERQLLQKTKNTYQDIESELNKLKADSRFDDVHKTINEFQARESLGRIEAELESLDEQIESLNDELEKCNNSFEDINFECKRKGYDLTAPQASIDKEEVEKHEKAYKDAQYDYKTHYYHLLNTHKLQKEINVSPNNYPHKLLIDKLLPSLYRNERYEEDQTHDAVERYLNEIHDKAKSINDIMITQLQALFEEVEEKYLDYKSKFDLIRNFFSDKDAEITGGHHVKITFNPKDDYPVAVLRKIRYELNSLASSIGEGNVFNTNKFTAIESVIEQAYRDQTRLKFPGSKHQLILALLNPFSYFEMNFSIIRQDGRSNKGSKGQKYASIALLCIAQMSEIYKNNQRELPKGIRYLPIDDAQDLGSNYDMLHTIAQKQDFQVITFSIETLKNLKIGMQNSYMLQENSEEVDINNHPFALLSSEKDRIFEWQEYLDQLHNGQRN